MMVFYHRAHGEHREVLFVYLVPTLQRGNAGAI